MLLSFREACEELKVRPSTLYQWAEAGLVPTIKIGGKLLRFEKETLLSWFKNGDFERIKREKLSHKNNGRNVMKDSRKIKSTRQRHVMNNGKREGKESI